MSGNHSYAQALLKEVDFPEDLVANTSLGRLTSYIPKLAGSWPRATKNAAET